MNSFTVFVVIIIAAAVGGADRILEVSEGTIVWCIKALPEYCNQMVNLCVEFYYLFQYFFLVMYTFIVFGYFCFYHSIMVVD